MINIFYFMVGFVLYDLIKMAVKWVLDRNKKPTTHERSVLTIEVDAKEALATIKQIERAIADLRKEIKRMLP